MPDSQPFTEHKNVKVVSHVGETDLNKVEKELKDKLPEAARLLGFRIESSHLSLQEDPEKGSLGPSEWWAVFNLQVIIPTAVGTFVGMQASELTKKLFELIKDRHEFTTEGDGEETDN